MLNAHRRLLQCAALVAAATGAAADAIAQAQLEEIIVTARRREENLMEVPIAITAVSVDMINTAGIKDLVALSAYTPGLHIDTSLTNATSRTLTFRGLNVVPGQIFVDGVSLALAGNGNPYLGSLERVEVLAGPQSVYFGRSTFTGALNFVTKRPGDEFKGKAILEYGTFNTADGSMSVEGPIVTDKLSARLTVHAAHTDGQWRNFSNGTERMGRRSSRSASSSIYWTPSDDLTVKFLLDHEWDDSYAPPAIALKGNNRPEFGGSGTQIPGVTGGSQEIFCPTNGTFGVYYCGALPSADSVSPRIISGNFEITPYLAGIFFDNRLNVPMHFNPRFLDHYGGKSVTNMFHMNIDYDTPSGWVFSSSSAYHHAKTQAINAPNYRDTRDVPNPNFNVPIPAGQPCCRLPYISFHLMMQNVLKDYDQDLRVTTPDDWRLRGTFGVSYLKQTSPGGTNFGQSKGVPQYQGSLTAQTSKTPAVYAGVYYDITEQLTLTAETRYQGDKVIATTTFPTAQPPREDNYKSFSPRVSLDYNYAPGSMVFGLFSRGYRRGGFNAILVGQPASVLAQLAPIGAGETFGQERIDNFELGAKSTWLDSTLRTQLVAYFQKWRNGQVPSTISFVQANGGVVNTSVTTNLGDVNLKGLEFTADWVVSDAFNISATANYTTSSIKNYNYIPVGLQIRRSANVTGNKFWGTPIWKATLSPRYETVLSGDWNWFARADVRYRGKYYIDGTNLAWLPSKITTDVGVGVARDTLRLEAYVSNLFDDREFTQGEYGADSSSTTGGSNENEIRLGLPRKREFGVKATYEF